MVAPRRRANTKGASKRARSNGEASEARPSGPDVYRQTARQWLRYNVQRFEETGLAVYAWDAIADSLSAGVPLPKSVRRYLHDVALQIVQLSRERYPRKGEIDRAVAKALRLNGSGKFNPFGTPRQLAHEIGIAVEVYQMHTRMLGEQRVGKVGAGTPDWTTVFKQVADEHGCDLCRRKIGAGTVKRYWYRHALTVIPPHLVARSQSQKLDDILR